MGALTTPPAAKLIFGMLSARAEVLTDAAERLARDYGPIDLTGPVLDWDYTDYYADEMGGGLHRRFLAMEPLIPPEELVAVKRATNRLEAALAGAPGGPARPVNIDPGYVTESKLVLASTKDFSHRVYLGQGVFAEVTLMYVGGKWAAQRYTFPDYASGAYDAFLSEAREKLRRQIRRGGKRGRFDRDLTAER